MFILESAATTLEDLKLHLVTCEVYECGNCVKRVKQLGKIKEHIEKEHKSRKVKFGVWPNLTLTKTFIKNWSLGKYFVIFL